MPQQAVSPWLIVVAAVTIWRIIYAYWTPVVHHYVVPPGDDAAFHIAQVSNALSGHIALFTESGYPLGFHNIVASLAYLFHQNAITAIIWIGPALLVIPIPVLYFAGKRLFGSTIVGAAAAASWGVLALAPVRAFGDGNYPNLVGGSILLPFAVAAIYQFVVSKKTWRRAIPPIVLAIAIALTHHLSFIYLIVATFPWLILTVIDNLLHPHTRRATLRYMAVTASVAVLLAVILGVVFGRLLAPYATALVQNNLVGIFGRESKPLDLAGFLEIHNPFFVILGLISALVLMLSKTARSLKLLVVTWLLTLIALSLVPTFGLPGRFAREAAIPLALCVGFLFDWLWHFLKPKRLQPLVPITLVSMLVASSVFATYRPFALPDPFLALIRVPHEEEPSLAGLDRVTPEGGVILANNSDPFIHFLVHHPVVVLNSQYNVGEYLQMYHITTVYIGPKPALTDDSYPYYRTYDEITSAIEKAPGLTLLQQLKTGSRIYRHTY